MMPQYIILYKIIGQYNITIILTYIFLLLYCLYELICIFLHKNILYMTKKKRNKSKKQPWSIPLESREDMYNGINPSADFGIGSFLSQGIGYLGGFRTGEGMNEDEARWAAYLGLPYNKEYAPDTKIRFEHDKDYPDRQYQGVSKRAKNEIREEVIPEAKRIKDKYGKEWIQVLDERGIFGNDSTIYHPRETYTGDLGKFGIREVGNSGIYEIGDKYDFPSWVPVPDRNEGTELMIRDTIWSDRANPKLYNKEIIKRKNKHSIGGLLGKLGDWNTNVTNSMFTNSSTGQATGFGKFAKGFGIKSGNIGGIANTAATAIGGALAGGKTTGVGNALQGIGSLASNIPGVGGLIGAGVNLVGGLVNATFGSKLNAEKIAEVEGGIKQMKNFTSNAGDFDALASNYEGVTSLGFSKSDIGSDGIFSDKASDEYRRLKREAEEAEQYQYNALANNAQNIASNNLQLLEANYNAYGGPIDMKYTGVMSPFGNQFKNGGIYIKPSKRGTFTAAAKKRGMGVQEFASKVLANKEDYSPAMVKKANFARNARKWKHADGGNLFTNGVTIIGNGGTHESNPYEGVQMGIDPQGIPNLVEEGEVIYDDYVFSNRLRVPKEVRQKYKLRGVTFADAAKQLQKESEERPNDPISKRGLNASMAMLQQEQETVRMKKESNKYAKGGRLGRIYEGEGDESNWLYKPFGVPTRDDILRDMEETYPFLKGEEELPIAPLVRSGVFKKPESTSTNSNSNSNWLRYAPIAGHAIGAFSDLFSSPDYSAANAIEAVDVTPATVGYTPVGNYLSYKPFDRDYYLNKLNADAAASRRAITNTSGGNRAAAMAGLLAADYNYGNQLGALSRQAEEYNQALRERVEGFNRQTNLANAEMGLKAAMANAESRNQATKFRLSQAGQVAAMRKAAKDVYDARRSNNINVLLEELGGLGTENWNRDWLDRLAKAGVLKIDSKGNPVISSAKGGKIRTKKKKGFTYG